MSAHLPIVKPYVASQRAALNFLGAALWHVPGAFGIVRILGPRYSLRCVLFHDVSDTESSFTRGLGGTISRKDFEATLKFLTKHYTPVSLQDVLASFEGRQLPLRPVLLTFDDAYASVVEFAAPLCASFGVPAAFFINASCLDNRQLGFDNLVCYVANVLGLNTINAAIRTVAGLGNWEVHSLAEVFARFLPSISLPVRRRFRDGLVRLAQINESDLAGEAGLYLSSQQLRDLATFNFEIGNHTYTHVNCRSLLADEFVQEIDRNRVALEAISGQKVRSFSVPYGASADLTARVLAHLQRSGYDANFLAQGSANSPHTQPWVLDRVSIKASGNAALFSEIEVLPRLRITRNRLLASSKWDSDRMDLENATPSASCHAPITSTQNDTVGQRGTLGL